MFGRKSEKLPKEDRLQLRLFDEAEAALETEEQDTSGEIEIKPYRLRKRGRRPLPQNLPQVEVIHDLSEDQKQCACGSQLSRIGEEISVNCLSQPTEGNLMRLRIRGSIPNFSVI